MAEHAAPPEPTPCDTSKKDGMLWNSLVKQCDGESQGTDGINFSLASREIIADMIEIHASATPFDGGCTSPAATRGCRPT